MAFLSNQEYYEMILCVGAANGSLRGARELYRERFIDGRPADWILSCDESGGPAKYAGPGF